MQSNPTCCSSALDQKKSLRWKKNDMILFCLCIPCFSQWETLPCFYSKDIISDKENASHLAYRWEQSWKDRACFIWCSLLPLWNKKCIFEFLSLCSSIFLLYFKILRWSDYTYILINWEYPFSHLPQRQIICALISLANNLFTFKGYRGPRREW